MTEVLSGSFHGSSHFASSPLQSSSHSDLARLNTSSISFADRPSLKPSYTHQEFETTSTSSSVPSSPELEHETFSTNNSYTATSASSISLDRKNELEDEDDILFPAFGPPASQPSSPYESDVPPIINQSAPLMDLDDDPPAQPANTPREGGTDIPIAVNDDQALEPEPTRHVDYLSHEWREEDIWSSWRYIVARRKGIPNGVRLENASWRTWMKAKNNLKTVSPEKLNWLKDCDVTWLYGPLQTGSKKPFTTSTSPAQSCLSRVNSTVGNLKDPVRPILKKKPASVAMLEKSLSTHSLLKQAGAMLQAQHGNRRGRPAFRRAQFTFSGSESTNESSVANTPAEHEGHFPPLRTSATAPDLPNEARHIHFNNQVQQVIAVDSDDDDKENEAPSVFSEEDEDEDDDCGLMMRPAPSQSKLTSSRSTPRNSFSNNNPKSIAPLPSTTLKYRPDTPEPDPAKQIRGMNPPWQNSKLQPSSSQETLRPSRPHHNFLIDDEDEADLQQWQPSIDSSSPYDAEGEPGPGLRRTESGMFMPYDDSEAEGAVNRTMFGQALNAVYTVKDIAHVVWNVGWGK